MHILLFPPPLLPVETRNMENIGKSVECELGFRFRTRPLQRRKRLARVRDVTVNVNIYLPTILPTCQPADPQATSLLPDHDASSKEFHFISAPNRILRLFRFRFWTDRPIQFWPLWFGGKLQLRLFLRSWSVAVFSRAKASQERCMCVCVWTWKLLENIE